MAQIKISVKGKLEMTLTRNYNSLSLFTANKDDVGFNETGNDFYNYCITSPCGSWVGDKIKILSLPNKGRLYYNSTPLSTPTYANVTVGQEIMVRDLIDYQVLRFSAEGSFNDEFTESYLTNFTFERYCVSTAQNITVKVNLNMIDDKVSPASIYVNNVVRDFVTGIATYDLHVEGAEFNGYFCGVMTNGRVNTREKLASLNNGFGTIFALKINSGEAIAVEDRKSILVSIPVGVYSGSIKVSAGSVPLSEDVSCIVKMGYSLDNIYENRITSTYVSMTLDRSGEL